MPSGATFRRGAMPRPIRPRWRHWSWPTRAHPNPRPYSCPAPAESRGEPTGEPAESDTPPPVADSGLAAADANDADESAPTLANRLGSAASQPSVRGAGFSLLGLAGSGLRTIYGAVIGTLALLLAVVLIPFYFYYFSVSYPKTSCRRSTEAPSSRWHARWMPPSQASCEGAS